MTKVDEGSLRNWNEGDVMKSDDYERERTLLVAAINGSDVQIKDRYTKAEADDRLLQYSQGIDASELIPNRYEPVTLTPGLQVLTSSKRAKLDKLNVKGRTLLNNLVGGNCEDVSKFSTFNATATLDSANAKYGANSLKVTLTATPGIAALPFSPTAGKKYVFVADVKNGNAASVGLTIYHNSGASTTVGPTTVTTDFNTLFMRWAPGASDNHNFEVRLTGTSGNFAYADGLRLYEITQAEYDALDTMTAEQVAAKYPYTEGIQGTWNHYVLKYGKNLLPLFHQWLYPERLIKTTPYSSSLTSIAGDAEGVVWSGYEGPCVGGVEYTLNIQHGGRIQLAFYDKSGVKLSGSYVSVNEIKAIAPSTAVKFGVYIANPAGAGTFTFTNPMLNIGTTALPFEPRVDDMLAVQDTFYANPVDGTYPDELNEVGGKLMKTQNWKALDLTGELNWGFNNDATGYKVAFLPMTGHIADFNQRATKYNGKPLLSVPSSTAFDQVALNASNLFISIADTDSGWGEGYTPTADEIKAYFYGWKMYKDGIVSTPYDGTGAKGWARYDHTLGWQGTATLPTTQSSTGLDGNGGTYKLLYRLATPVTYEVASEGSVTLHEGSNQVETGVGMVVRERSNLSVVSGNTYVGANIEQKYRSDRFIATYKNSLLDGSFINSRRTTLDTQFGWGYAVKTGTEYDKSASFTVTYTALDLYKVSAPVPSITASYASNDKTRTDDAITIANRAEAAVRTLLNVKAEKNPPQLITPTLLNAWTQFPNYDPVGYYKDAEGYVHVKGMMTGSATTTDIFRLPKGYRPSNSNIYVVAANNSTTDGTAHILIDNTGIVRHRSGYYGWVSFGEIIFKAEK